MKLPASVDMAKLSDKVSNRRTGPVFEETIEDKIIQSLVYVELKALQIRESSCWQSDSVMCLSIRELLESNHENVLAYADQYPKEPNWPFSRPADIHEAFRKENRRPHWHMLDIFLSIEMARTMPVFSQLDYNDQEAVLKQMVLANAILLQAFYSFQMKSETVIMPNGFLPAKMTMEEFVLLKAIIYSHSAIHGLSERGRVLLERESVRYSKTLMKHLQSRMGAAPGAKKYAEIVSFVGCLFHAAQQQREMHVYIGAVVGPAASCPPYMETIMYA
ncbi:nuclear hormone receptor family member nhr-60 [Ditylenchus destructor]|nr:nuclear hormone receptor family member nhr-60 [Ditylenchus destructor]